MKCPNCGHEPHNDIWHILEVDVNHGNMFYGNGSQRVTGCPECGAIFFDPSTRTITNWHDQDGPDTSPDERYDPMPT